MVKYKTTEGQPTHSGSLHPNERPCCACGRAKKQHLPRPGCTKAALPNDHHRGIQIVVWEK
eukprot:15483474-Alexandrium_andersonii.AAC.1